MLDLEKEVKRLNGYIKNTMKPDDRQIEVDAYHAMEMLERAIAAEKALKKLANLTAENLLCVNCPLSESICNNKDITVMGCFDFLIKWALQEDEEEHND